MAIVTRIMAWNSKMHSVHLSTPQEMGKLFLQVLIKKSNSARGHDFYGNVIIIRHANELYTLYAHLSNIFVKEGDKVSAGDMIGEVGDTGGATGSHLHFEVRKGGDGTDYFSTQNPELWLIPHEGTGTLSITLKLDSEQNIERPLVVSYYVR